MRKIKLSKKEKDAIEVLIERGMLDIYNEEGQTQLNRLVKPMDSGLRKIEAAGLGIIDPLIMT